jgi:hypothetical protein
VRLTENGRQPFDENPELGQRSIDNLHTMTSSRGSMKRL